jgi:AraC-like DNA-binding protein
MPRRICRATGRFARAARPIRRLDHTLLTLEMDALSELLKAVKLSGAMFFNGECTAPWCLRSPPSQFFCPYIGPTSGHVIEFHLLTEGSGYVRVGEETTPLSAGDVLMLPHGDAHVMGNGVGATEVDSASQLPALLGGQLSLAHLGGGGERTRLICGYLSCDAGLIRPVLGGLPRVMRIHIRTDAAGEWLENSIRHAVDRATSGAPGSEVILARLAEVLFAETLLRYVQQLPAGREGWLAGAADAAVGRSLAALHRKPAHPWTLEELAREAGLSRSALTERFARYLGQAPMAYLLEWRLALGAEALRSTSRSVIQIATAVGYDSEAAFNRAFKRRFGAPPARFRRQSRARPTQQARAT